ncbi:protein FAM136A-like [Ischnura elegans]|uniref:protein FAM136A-like n=1 Tax=Ischnura elegans TaxID=197161 RepID=UPI001ED88873|nr:protein FAM136A-like [Ischnura elegans]
MQEEKKSLVESGLKKLVSDVDKSFLRKMEEKMYLCSAKCCESRDSSYEEVRSCVDRCSAPVMNAQNTVRGELEYFQIRLQRCVNQCHDDIQHKMSATPDAEEVERATKLFDSCAAKCFDDHVSLLPGLLQKISQKVQGKVT